MLNGVVLGLLMKPVYAHRSTDAEWGGAGITDKACSHEAVPGASRHHNEYSSITSRSVLKVYLHS